jgi:hypothetical protein
MARAAERPNRYFTFLRRLRAEGRSNMYGAIPYLAAAFGVDRNEAFRIICEWIDSQEALSADSAVPKASVPAERAAAPTLFDPVHAANAAAVAEPAVGVEAAVASKRARRKPATRKAVKQRKPEEARANPKAAQPVKQRPTAPAAAPVRSRPRAAARKKPPHPSDSRAA